MLAQRILANCLDFAIFTDSFMISNGSIPVSAILPANIDSIAGISGFNTLTTFFSWSKVKMAVTLQTIFLFDNFLIKSQVDSPLVFVMGIFTLTFFPQVEISKAIWKNLIFFKNFINFSY